MDNRRSFLKKSAFLSIAGLAYGIAGFGNVSLDEQQSQDFVLPPLPYAYDALEPYIDKMTMEIHHGKHHQAYVNNLNKAVKESGLKYDLSDLIRNASKYSAAVRNNGGGHWNHSFFWKLMSPNAGGEPTGKIAEEINSVFGSFSTFQEKLNDIAMKRFGSGWAWLVVDQNGKLAIGSTPNQDNPMMDLAEFKGSPVLGVDVWEHAYYLKYQNMRANYLKAWWSIINWEEVNKNLVNARG